MIPQNDAPVIAAIETITMNEDETTTVPLSGSDADGDEINFVSNPVFDATTNELIVTSQLSSEGDVLTLTPAPNWFGQVEVPVSVYDATGLSSSITFTLIVENVNDAPTFNEFVGDLNMNEDVPITITLSASDIDDTDLTYSAVATPEQSLNLTVDGAALTITPAENYIGDASVAVTVTDPGLLSETYSFNVNVIGLVDAPIIVTIPDVTILEDASTTIPLFNNDADGDFSHYLVDAVDNVTTIVSSEADFTISESTVDNYSLSFDGQNDLVEVVNNSNLPEGLDNFTFSSLIKIGNFNDDHRIILCNNITDNFQFAIRQSSDNFTSIDTYIGGVFSESSSIEWEADRWYQITITRESGSILKFYRDGVFINSSENTGVILNENIEIGYRSANAYNHPFDGLLDNISIWSQALTESQIQSNLNANLSGNEEGLVAFWNFNEGSGNVLTDLSGNGNNGTINGATWIQEASL